MGTWTDFVPVAVTVTDSSSADTGCPVGFGGVIKEKFTLQIVAGAKANQVIVHELQPLIGQVTLTRPCSAAQQTPDEQKQTLTTIADFARPYAMNGTVSSSRLTLTGDVYGQIETVGSLSFTSDVMSGTMSLRMPFEGATFSSTTAPHAVKLTRKH